MTEKESPSESLRNGVPISIPVPINEPSRPYSINNKFALSKGKYGEFKPIDTLNGKSNRMKSQDNQIKDKAPRSIKTQIKKGKLNLNKADNGSFSYLKMKEHESSNITFKKREDTEIVSKITFKRKIEEADNDSIQKGSCDKSNNELRDIKPLEKNKISFYRNHETLKEKLEEELKRPKPKPKISYINKTNNNTNMISVHNNNTKKKIDKDFKGRIKLDVKYLWISSRLIKDISIIVDFAAQTLNFICCGKQIVVEFKDLKSFEYYKKVYPGILSFYIHGTEFPVIGLYNKNFR